MPVCPPEGDAGTGMAATNSVAVRTGNVSAGTSVFAMIVLEKELSRMHTEIDMVTTPSGSLVAMAHANNCTSDLNAWVSLFREFAEASGMKVDMNALFSTHTRSRVRTAAGFCPTATTPGRTSSPSTRGVRCSCARRRAGSTWRTS